MSENLLYLLATLADWLGWGLAIGALIRLVTLFLPGASSDRTKALATIAAMGGIAAILLIVGSNLPVLAGGPKPTGLHIPLVWLVMPFWAWVGVVSVAMVAVRGAQALLAMDGTERGARLKAGGIWLLVAALSIYIFKTGPDSIITLHGQIELTLTNLVVIVLLIVAGGAGMRYTASRATTNHWSKTLLTQVMLVAGSIVFGLPFAFLLITSFKEDVDMSSPNGIIWVPKVEQMVKYWDPKNPLMEGTYEGRRIEGSVVSKDPDGKVEVEVNRPASMRGLAVTLDPHTLKEIPRDINLVTASLNGQPIQGKVIETLLDGQQRVVVTMPANLAGQEHVFKPSETVRVRKVGLRWANYSEALEFLPPETANGLVYLKNTLIIVLLSVIGTVLSSSVVAYAFARMRFPGKDLLFGLLLATMMLPAAVTMLPKFLMFRAFGWIDTLYPLWVPAFFASAFNVFLLRQFFKNIPSELEDAARIDGCNPARTFWSVMLPLVKPALAVIAIWGFMNAWNDFMGPLTYISSPEKMPLSYALKLFQGERQGEPGLLMAFATMTMVPVLLLFFFAQRYFVEGVALSGLGGR